MVGEDEGGALWEWFQGQKTGALETRKGCHIISSSGLSK